ncbi:type-F conjugative transfer system secretin TraK [Photobacterium damselae]|uniref:type-F conjugative transfer system secretin TraK n=1 Tax=Photobacterium damselae TaxID=38293 RepID=UPI004068B975
MSKYPAVLGLCALIFAPTVLATAPNTVLFSDNETVSVNLSSLDINRLVVKDDKITSVTCPTGFCTMPANPVGESGMGAPIDPQGAGLISLNVLEPFTLYITTEKGRGFGVFVRPLAVPAITTVFLSTERDTQKAQEFEKQSPYDQTLASLISHMIKETIPEGFAFQKITAKKPIEQAKLLLTPTASYQGEHLTGITYKISNKTAQYIKVEPTSFYGADVKAVSFSSMSIPPHGSIYMYQIQGR